MKVKRIIHENGCSSSGRSRPQRNIDYAPKCLDARITLLVCYNVCGETLGGVMPHVHGERCSLYMKIPAGMLAEKVCASLLY